MKRCLNRLLIFWACLIAFLAIFGQVSLAASDAGRTAADFLLIGQGARAAGMGGAYTAVSEDAVAAYWNPSGLTSLESGQVALGHFSWFQDITVEQASLAFPLTDAAAAAVSISYVNYGTIEGYDAGGAATGELSAYDWVGGLSLAYRLGDRFSIGLTGKYVNQRLADVSAAAFAADFGLRYRIGAFALATSVRNVGSQMKFDQVAEDLPASLHLGIAARPLDYGLTTSLEFEQRFQGDLLVRQGLEMGFGERYYLRTGYDYVTAQEGQSLAARISLGAGLRLDFADFDYAFTPNDKSTAEDLHRFTLTFRFAD
jgi:hypothetical protein